MIITEQNIRNFFKTLTVEDIANSVHFFGIDFDNESIETIMQILNRLYEDVKTLRNIIDRDFKSQNGERLPKDEHTQRIIIKDCNNKETVLFKVLSNGNIYNMFIEFKFNNGKKPAIPVK